MPNHVTNIISFSGKKADIKALLKAVKGKESIFDINSFYPMPKDLEGTSSPVKIVSEEERKEWEAKKAAGKLSEWEADYAPITLKMQREFLRKHGADNWYDWRIQNWGTKWGAYDVVDNGDGTITFDTAWSTPVKAIERLSSLHPTVEITVKYADEDFGHNVGEYTLMAGSPESFAEVEGGSIEALRMVLSVKSRGCENEDYHLTDMLCDDIQDEESLTEWEEQCTELAHEFGVLCDDYAKPVLEKLLELATRDEQFERAAKLQKLLKKA